MDHSQSRKTTRAIQTGNVEATIMAANAQTYTSIGSGGFMMLIRAKLEAIDTPTAHAPTSNDLDIAARNPHVFHCRGLRMSSQSCPSRMRSLDIH